MSAAAEPLCQGCFEPTPYCQCAEDPNEGYAFPSDADLAEIALTTPASRGPAITPDDARLRKHVPKVACPPHTFEPMVGGPDVCHCGTTFLEWTRGFSMRTSTFQMPPSRNLRKKSAVAKRFGKAFGEGD